MIRGTLTTLILAALVFGLGCSKNITSTTSVEALPLIGTQIISDRAQNTESVVTIIRLRNPSLFETATKDENGKLVINEKQKQAILVEQKEMLEKLHAVSKDISLLYTYKFVLNAITVVVPVEFTAAVNDLSGATLVRATENFERPLVEKGLEKSDKAFTQTSVDFIQATEVHNELEMKGEGIKVGILDTGIDYTHAMFGGPGTAEAFKAVNPDKDSELFPNKKVIGGIDLVGTKYGAGSAVPAFNIPRPDKNPIDEGGHGTHVAGTVAGLGDGVNTYDGVAPEASLYAIKVFGANGSTGDAVVIAGLEYAADPNGDLNPDDKLDVVNLSLGGGYGKPYIMYSEAVRNLVKGGIVMVASAGNSGPTSYIVGSPGTSDDAISIGASVDNMEHIWKFKSVEFVLGESTVYSELIEGNISKPIAEAQDIKGKLVFAGTAATDFSDELKAKVKGNVALIDRGAVSFVDKLKRAFDAGAIGVIVANNQPGDAFRMGGEGKIDLPAIMTTQAFGSTLKNRMKVGEVIVSFASDKLIEKPELIDTLTSFSSRGPRSGDSLIKPEIAAPGFQIFSADMGGGTKGKALNGTSMSAPHMSGVMALLVQAFPKESTKTLKAIVLNTAKSISDSSGKTYSVAMQGAGRVQTFKAATATMVVTPATISLGELNLATKKMLKRTLTFRNLKDESSKLTVKLTSSTGLTLKMDKSFTLGAMETKTLPVRFLFESLNDDVANKELDGIIEVYENDSLKARIPSLAVVRYLSEVKAEELKVFATGTLDAEGAEAAVKLTNFGPHKGTVLPFNLLATDNRKKSDPFFNSVSSRACDLQSAGYKIIKKDDKDVLQIAVKLYQTVSRWEGCELSAQIDIDGDGTAEQELVGINQDYLEGLGAAVQPGYYSVLLDAKKAREIRANYERVQVETQGSSSARVNFLEAVQDIKGMTTFNHSTIAVMEADVSALKLNRSGFIKVKLGVLNNSGGVESDDFFNKSNEWLDINPNASTQGFTNLPESIKVGSLKEVEVSTEKGHGDFDLVLYLPNNKPGVLVHPKNDTQQIILKPEFQF